MSERPLSSGPPPEALRLAAALCGRDDAEALARLLPEIDARFANARVSPRRNATAQDDEASHTLLAHALRSGAMDCAQLLLEAGANPNAPTGLYRISPHNALLKSQSELKAPLLLLLQEHGGRPHAREENPIALICEKAPECAFAIPKLWMQEPEWIRSPAHRKAELRPIEAASGALGTHDALLCLLAIDPQLASPQALIEALRHPDPELRARNSELLLESGAMRPHADRPPELGELCALALQALEAPTLHASHDPGIAARRAQAMRPLLAELPGSALSEALGCALAATPPTHRGARVAAQLCESLLDLGANADHRMLGAHGSPWLIGSSLLHLCAASAQTPAAQVLLSRGADAQALDPRGRTPQQVCLSALADPDAPSDLEDSRAELGALLAPALRRAPRP